MRNSHTISFKHIRIVFLAAFLLLNPAAGDSWSFTTRMPATVQTEWVIAEGPHAAFLTLSNVAVKTGLSATSRPLGQIFRFRIVSIEYQQSIKVSLRSIKQKTFRYFDIIDLPVKIPAADKDPLIG